MANFPHLLSEEEYVYAGYDIFRFEIVDIYPLEKWKDVCISEIDAGYQGQYN